MRLVFSLTLLMNGGDCMNNTIIHQKLVDDILLAAGSLPHVRVWPRIVGTFRSLYGNRKVTIGPLGGADITGLVYVGGRGIFEMIHPANPFMSRKFELHSCGLRLEIEVKTGKGKQSNQQKNFESMINGFGGIYIVARSVDDVLTVLNRYA